MLLDSLVNWSSYKFYGKLEERLLFYFLKFFWVMLFKPVIVSSDSLLFEALVSWYYAISNNKLVSQITRITIDDRWL